MDDRHVLSDPDAVDALIEFGWPVAPAGDNMDLWRIGIATFTDAELLEFAAWADIVPGSDQVH